MRWGCSGATPWGNARLAFYGGEDTPSVFWDGVEECLGTVGTLAEQYAWYEGVYLARRAVRTDVTVTLNSFQLDPTTFRIWAIVCVEPAGAAKTMRIYMAQVLDQWPADPAYMRNGLKQAAETEDVAVTPGGCQTVVRDFSLDAASWADKDNVRIVVWAQEPYDEGPAEIYQTAVLSWPFVLDCNGNQILDECDLDCGPPGGECDVPGCGSSANCNHNDLPDECDLDCNDNGVPDDCDVDPNDPDDDGVVYPDCDASGVPDSCEPGGNEDCNGNGTPDLCDIYLGTSLDCQPNAIPDECEGDCNGNQVPDDCDLTAGTSLDCNENDAPDECDIAGGTSEDCQPNGVPDECDLVTPLYASVADQCGNAGLVCPGLTYYGTTAGATVDGSAQCGHSNGTPDVWYYYESVGYGSLTVSLCGSAYDTVLSVHSGCPGTAANQLACNDDWCSEQSRVSISVNPSGHYWIRISGASGATGDFVMTLLGPACHFDRDVNDNQIPDECEVPCHGQSRGDCNGDGKINGLDIDPFIAALVDPGQYNLDYAPLTWQCTADANCDGVLSQLDLDAFVECLTRSCPPCDQ